MIYNHNMLFKLTIAITALCALVLMGASCSEQTATQQKSNSTVINANQVAVEGSWVPNTKGPWDGAIYATTSTDGLEFTGQQLLFSQAGVPNLLRLADNTLILTYQYFSSTNEDMFDVITYSISEDNGVTWSDTTKVTFENLPSPLDPAKHPMDPTLVQLSDGRLRLYFTYHAKGNKTAALYSATTADDQITSPFVTHATPALVVNEANLLDPAVVYFNGLWHHYSWSMDSENNYHSTSSDGVNFTRQADVSLNQSMDFLGQVIQINRFLRFYGTGGSGIISAVSEDANQWQAEPGTRVPQGADPAVQQLPDSSYLMVYTSMNFN